MKLTVIFLFAFMTTVMCFAQVPSPTPALAVASPIDAAPPIASPAPAALPSWVADLLSTAQSFPVVGPIVSKVVLYAGVIASILTALVAFLLAACSALSGVLNVAGLTTFATQLQSFKNSKIMYYLMYLSMFNAQKPAPALAIVADVEAAVQKAA